MWIDKRKYECLNRMAKDNGYYTRVFHDLIECLKKKKLVLSNDFVIMSRDTWNKVSNEYSTLDERIKDIEAELEWYKVKYHEMKANINT